ELHDVGVVALARLFSAVDGNKKTITDAGLSVVYFLLMVGLLVAVHELGHFTAAKALGVRVLRFSLGFGPPIVRLRGRETEYQIGAVPPAGDVTPRRPGPSGPAGPPARPPPVARA